MEQFNQLFKNILLEQDMDVFKVGIFPGAFKPPHIGHFTTAYNACKDNDMVYIFVSDKPRPLSTQNKGKAEIPDINRYSNIMNSDKYTSNLLGVQPAGVARMTSATAFRAAISLKDKNTIAKNLPDGVDSDAIFSTLMRSNDIGDPGYGHVTVDQTMEIWNHYKPILHNLTGLTEDRLKIIVSSPSPVKDTYDLVERLNNSDQANNTSVRLYVGE
jgi:cytidyltransferase-like protein